MSLAMRRTGIYERFDLLAELGRGGLGGVVRAFDRMKLIDEGVKAPERFERALLPGFDFLVAPAGGPAA